MPIAVTFAGALGWKKVKEEHMTNADRWAKAKFNRSTDINKQADKIAANRARYQAVSKDTGVPWDVIGVIHYREASGSFDGVLHNGERIIGTGAKTKLVPKGRGPFKSWEEAAVDALVTAPPYAAKNTDWSIGGTLDLLERYNGLGYRNKGLPSPYLWAGTDQYVKGKYVADGKYDPNHVDRQLGVAPILMKLREGIASAPAKPIIIEPAPHLGPPDAPIPRTNQPRSNPAFPPDAPIIVHDEEPIIAKPAPKGVVWGVGFVILAGVVYFILKQMGIVP